MLSYFKAYNITEKTQASSSPKKEEDWPKSDPAMASIAVPLESNPVKMDAPSRLQVNRGDGSDEQKSCRICLEDDDPQGMIAPCRCKGSSKWVHRQCLNQWRIHESDRAFSKCTECMFNYHMQPVIQNPRTGIRRRAKFAFFVSRDICMVTIGLQLIIAALGGFLYLVDTNEGIPDAVNPDNPIGAYYLFGFLIFLVLLGIMGVNQLWANDCSVGDTMERYQVRPDPDFQQSYQARSSHYRQRRQQHSRSTASGNDCYCCHGCHYNSQPGYYGGYGEGEGCNAACYGCCICCNPDLGPSRAPGHSSACCDCCPVGDCGGDGAECLCVLLIFVIAFLAVAGLFTAVVTAVVVLQRTVQRHVYILQKRLLTQEFQVLDLSNYDLEQGLPPTTSTGENKDDAKEETSKEPPIPSGNHPEPSAPPSSLLSLADRAFLKNMGLMERESDNPPTKPTKKSGIP